MMFKTFGEILARFDDDHAYDGDDVIEALNDAREAVGGDPSEWYVLDADGNKVHKDDTVKLGVSEFKVICVGITNGKPSFCYRDNDGWLYIARAHKVVPDTREKIIEDTLAKLVPYGVGGGKVAEAIEDAIDRAMKLPEVDA